VSERKRCDLYHTNREVCIKRTLKQFHILSTDVVKVKSACVTNVNPISKIRKLICKIRKLIRKLICFPFEVAHFQARAFKKDTSFILDIMQVTFVTVPIVVSTTANSSFSLQGMGSFSSQGMGTQAKTSNVMKHMPTQFQLYVSGQQMERAPRRAWLERRGHPCMKGSHFLNMCPRICASQFLPFRTQSLTQIDHKIL